MLTGRQVARTAEVRERDGRGRHVITSRSLHLLPEGGRHPGNSGCGNLRRTRLDIRPGDRASLCRGRMEPISLWMKEDGETMILHRCTICGSIKANRLAGDDDDLAVRNIAERLLQRM
ncbi:MAG: RNHCP domain-containing protein [Spirochaetota bacterium]|nr:RNHCP domain-containing protein [Spirochaetota bacterium]